MNEITTEERLRIVEELNRTANDSLRCLKRNRDRGRIDAPWLA